MQPNWLNYPEFLSGPNKASTDAQNWLIPFLFKLLLDGQLLVTEDSLLISTKYSH